MLKLLRKFNPKALLSFSFFTILFFFAAALVFNIPPPAVYGAGTANAWNLERSGTDLNVYFSTGGANALILKSNGEMQARKIYDIDNISQYFIDPSLTSSLNTLGIGITAPFYKLQTSSGFVKTDTNNRVISMFGSNEGTTSWGLKIAMTGAATTTASSLILQTGDNATNNGNLGLQSYGGNVGIGTTTPSTPLEVWYNTATPLSHGLQLINRNTTAGRTGDITLGVWDGGNFLRSRIYHTSDSPYGWTDQRLTFATQATGADNYTDTMTLKNGQVGIGTITPTTRLHVVDGTVGATVSKIHHTGTAGSPGNGLWVSNGYPTSQGSGSYEIFNVSSDNYQTKLLTVKDNGAVRFDKGNIHMPRFDTTPGFYGISAPDTGYFPDGTPYYMGFGREAGAFDGSVIAGSPFPDLLISNHTGIKLVGGYGPYGGVSVYDNYNYANATWPGVGSEVARFRHALAGGSYFTSNLGVRTSGSPASDLHVKQSGNSQNGGGLRLERADTGGFAQIFEGSDQQLYLFTNSNNQWCIVTLSATISCSSDKRLKENIFPLKKGALDIISLLKPSTFTWKEGKKNSAGFIAQEVLEVLPEAVEQNKETGYYSVADSYFTPYLVKGVQELNEKFQKQEEENKQLRDDLELLKKEIQLIKEKK